MIVSPGRGYIFVHAPKTGGTSLALALEARAMKDDVLIGDTPKARRRRARAHALPARGRLWKHSTLADLDGWLAPADLDAFYCVTLVRNPWDRAVSYYQWLRGQHFDHPAVDRARERDFPTFLRHEQTVASLRHWTHARYVTDATGTERADLFVRLENLAEDIAPFEARLGFRLAIPHANRSDRGDYRRYYDDALAEHLRRVCAADIARFGYRFGP
jgi:hypothetical protein